MAAKKGGNSPWRGRVRGQAKSIKKRRNRGKPGTKSTEVVYHSTKEIKVERALIENFIGLQRVMVSLSAKFDSLSSQISSLLQLFEISAKSLARKELSSEAIDSRKVMEKLDRLSAQAGLIGKGLALIHEVGTEEAKPMIPLNAQNRQQPAKPKTAMPFQSPQVNQSAATKPEPKMTREVAPEHLATKTKPSVLEENVS